MKCCIDENLLAVNESGYTFLASMVMYDNGEGYFMSHPLDFDNKIIKVTKDSIITSNKTFKIVEWK